MSKKAPACFAKSSGHVFNHPRREIELKESVLGSDWTWKLLMASLATTVDNTIKMADTVRKHGCQWCIRSMKTATHGADEGRLDQQKSVLTSRRQKFCESATARPHDGAVKWGQRLPNSRFVPSPRCSNKITILCKHIEACSCTTYCDMHVPVRALANCSHHSSIVHCLHPVTSCKACRCAFDQRSVGIWERDQLWVWSHRKFWKKRDGASWFWEILFPFAGAPAKCRRNGQFRHILTAIRVGQTAKVLKIHSSFGPVCGIYNGAQMGNDRQTEPELKHCGPTRVRDRCINASVTCDPRQN